MTELISRTRAHTPTSSSLGRRARKTVSTLLRIRATMRTDAGEFVFDPVAVMDGVVTAVCVRQSVSSLSSFYFILSLRERGTTCFQTHTLLTTRTNPTNSARCHFTLSVIIIFSTFVFGCLKAIRPCHNIFLFLNYCLALYTANVCVPIHTPREFTIIIIYPF